MKKAYASVLGFAAVLAAVLVCGCLPFPLGSPQKSQVDPALEGSWVNQQANGQSTVATLYPFDSHAYVLQSRDVLDTDGRIETKSRFLAKAWLTKLGEQTFLTLEPLAQKLASNTEAKVYPVFRLKIAKDKIEAQRVSEDFAPFKSAKNSADIERIIRENLDNPSLYAGEPAIFHRLNPDRDSRLIEQ